MELLKLMALNAKTRSFTLFYFTDATMFSTFVVHERIMQRRPILTDDKDVSFVNDLFIVFLSCL